MFADGGSRAPRLLSLVPTHSSHTHCNDTSGFALQVKFEMDFVAHHEFEHEESILCDLSEQKARPVRVKVEPSSPSSSPSLDLSSESDSIPKVPSLGDLYEENSLGGKYFYLLKTLHVPRWHFMTESDLLTTQHFACLSTNRLPNCPIDHFAIICENCIDNCTQPSSYLFISESFYSHTFLDYMAPGVVGDRE